jgi:hypothetical protein
MLTNNLFMLPKLSYIEHKELDFDRWDRCVASCEHPQPYGFSWYLNWLSPKWDGIVYGDYEVVLPVFPQKKWGITFTTRPYGTQAIGPFSTIPLAAEWIEHFVKFAMQHFDYGEFFLSSTTPLPANWSAKSYSNFVLSTREEYPELANRYSSQIKRNLKTAQKQSFEDAHWISVAEVASLWRNNTQEKTNISDDQWNRLTKALEFCAYQKRASVLGVYGPGNELLAAQVWVEFAGRSTLLMNASTDEGKSTGAPTFLIDAYIRSNARKTHVLDFEGSSIEGLARFYAGFGATDEPYFLHIENKISWPLKYLKPKSTR